MTKQNRKQKIYTTLKPKQQIIIDLLLKFRHLNQQQIQKLLEHKGKYRVRIWLNDLTDKGFLFKIYTNEIAPKPSVYGLARKSIGYLRAKGIDEMFLKRLYAEKEHSPEYRDHCMFVAAVYLSLLAQTKKNDSSLAFHTKTDLHVVHDLILPHPDAYYDIVASNGEVKRYFLEVFYDRTFIYKRVYQYLTYNQKRYWQSTTEKPFPEIMYICPDDAAKQSIYTFIQKKLTYDSPVFYLTTKQEVQKQGLCSEVLEKVEVEVLNCSIY